MWKYIVFGALMAYVAYWLIWVIRKRIAYEIYEACGLGLYFTLISLGWAWSGLGLLLLRIVGSILYLPAIFFVASSFITLKTRGKPKAGWEQTTAIINTGVFRIVRHPLYLGTAIWAVGVALVQQAAASVALGAVALYCFWMASKKEDEFNIEKFGDEYRRYVEKVPMWNFFRGIKDLRKVE